MATSFRNTLCALLSSVMLTASFPPGKLQWMAWFALVPLLKSIESQSPSQAFKLGFITGTAHYLTLIYWIVFVTGHYGDLNVFASLSALLLLSLYLSLFPAFFSTLTVSLESSRFLLLYTASFWVGLEYVRSKLLTGFPWCLLGYTQYANPHLIQIADLFGVYGVSFLIVLMNGLIYRCIFYTHHGKRNELLKWEILLAALVLGGTLAYGHYRLSEAEREKAYGHSIKAVIIQGNIDQSIKWDPSYQAETMAIYQKLTHTGYDFGATLIVWPETSVPFFFQANREFSPRVFDLAKESGALLIFGSPAYKRTGGMIKYYNRAYLITPDAQSLQYYDKVHLVPFGEYVPLKRFLFFLNRLVPATGDFEPGDKIDPLNHNDLSLGILICFEAIFPELARAHARKGAHILVNLTNDAWFGMTSAPYQHLSMAVFRAVENKRPMIRSANTGFSAFIRPTGEIAAVSSLFSREVLKGSVSKSKPSLTFYARFGDLFALSLLVISLVKIFASLRRRLPAGG